jgi:predicted Rossmann fold flavoprotein
VAESALKSRIAVIGGGAAGFMAAIEAAAPHTEVQLFEKSNKLLSKVRISGGGRCNVLHHCPHSSELLKAYPRGGRSLKKAFGKFAYAEAREWFESRGLELKVESDGRVFPSSDDSASVIKVMEREAHHRKVQIHLGMELRSIHPQDGAYRIEFRDGESLVFDKLILAFGGQPKLRGLQALSSLDIDFELPVPSLFTFNVKNPELHALKGLSVPNAEVQIPGTKARQSGPLLITHWGFSGPAVLKLSAWEARSLAALNYQFPILINWTGCSENEIRTTLQETFAQHPQRSLGNAKCFNLATRLWQFLLQNAGIAIDKPCAELSKKSFNRLVEQLFRAPYAVEGKSTFKDEFVTAGGVKRSNLHLDRYEFKKYPGLYAIGEMIDVDAITGGFNFQHAWTSGFLAGQHAQS